MSGPIEEGSQMVINCAIHEGNPNNTIVQYWEFESKYPGDNSQALPEQREERMLRVENTVYSDAGTYRCTAGNTIGTDAEEIQIVIHCEY